MRTEREKAIRRRGRASLPAFSLVLPALVLGALSLSCLGELACRRGPGHGAGRQREGQAAEVRASQEPNQPQRNHPAFRERVSERRQMVMRQIELRDVQDPSVLAAMRTVPRHAFVPVVQQASAYEDRPLYIGHGQTISQPYIVAFMTEALRLDPNAVVLEIGTGSGYQAAVCAEIAKEVYTIEIVEPLAKSAAQVLTELGYRNIHTKIGDGYFGWPEHGPFDAIIGTAAAGQIPPPLLEQLQKGGRMILPVASEYGFQYLVLVTKDEQGRLHHDKVLPVQFVPMTGRVQQPPASAR